MTEIDELSVKIDVDMPKGIDKTISSLANSINKLNRAVSNVSGLQKYVNTLSKISAASINVVGGTSVGRTTGGGANKLQKENIGSIDTSTGQMKSKVDINNKVADATKNVNKAQKEQNKEVKKGAGFWSKLTKSLGRIAFYRAIRAALKAITQGLSQGLENLRSVDKQLDTSMNRLSQSGTTLKNSFAGLIAPLIQSLEPVITRIADGIANTVNSINEAKAAMSGASTYTKILTSDTEEYQKALNKANGSLLEFDKFTSLGKGGYKGVTTADVTMGDAEIEKVKEQYGWLTSIKNLIFDIGEIAKYIWEKVLHPVLSGIVDIIKWLDDKELLKPLLIGILAVILAIKSPLLTMISGIVLLINNWGELSAGAKVATIALTALAGAIMAIKIASAGWGAIAMGIAIAGGITAGLVGLSKIGKFKDGGIPEKGTMFLAGEAGAEAVYNTGSGQTGVVNIEQFTTAMYNALTAYGAAQNNGNRNGDVYLDGSKVGQLVEKSVYNEGVRVGHFSKR